MSLPLPPGRLEYSLQNGEVRQPFPRFERGLFSCSFEREKRIVDRVQSKRLLAGQSAVRDAKRVTRAFSHPRQRDQFPEKDLRITNAGCRSSACDRNRRPMITPRSKRVFITVESIRGRRRPKLSQQTFCRSSQSRPFCRSATTPSFCNLSIDSRLIKLQCVMQGRPARGPGSSSLIVEV